MIGSQRSRPAAALVFAAFALLLGLAPPASAETTLGVQPDGKIVHAGFAYPGFGALIRYLPNGELDRSFGNEGIAIERRLEPFSALALQPDGAILAAAPRAGSDGPRPLFGRFLADGSADPGFGSAGLGLSPVEPILGAWPTAIVPRADGSILLGTNHCCFKYAPPGFASVEQFAGSGPFGGELSRLSHVGSWSEPFEITDLLPLADGSLIGAGRGPKVNSGGPNEELPMLVRFQAGAPGGYDHAFAGGAGFAFGTGTRFTAVAASAGGGYLVTGSGFTGPQTTVSRFDAGGVLDGSYATGGTYGASFGVTSNLTDVVGTPDGGAIAVGYAFTGVDPEFRERPCQDCTRAVVLKLDATGAPDPSFGQNGVLLLGGSGPVPALRGESVVLLADGRILLAGTGEGDGQPSVLVRLLPDGSLDSSFGNGGAAVTTPCGESRSERLAAGCISRLKFSLRVKHAGSRQPVLQLKVRPRESWAGIQGLQLILPGRFELHRQRIERRGGLHWALPGDPTPEAPKLHRRSVNFTRVGGTRAVRLRLSRGAFTATGAHRRLKRLPFRVKVKMAPPVETRTATLRRP